MAESTIRCPVSWTTQSSRISRKSLTIALATSLLLGCADRHPLRIGSSYTVALKPGSQAACFVNESNYKTWKTFLDPPMPWSRIHTYELSHALLLNDGDKVKVLSKSLDEDDLRVEVLSTGALCFVNNGGGGPGLGLFGCPYLDRDKFYWSVPKC